MAAVDMYASMPPSSAHKIMQAIGVLLAVAIGTRIAAGFLMPLVPGLVAMALLAGIVWFLFRRSH